MKQKLYKFLFFSSIFVMIYSCEYENEIVNYHSQNHEEKHFKVTKVNYNQLKRNKKLLERLGSIKNTKQQPAEKIITSNDNSFFIDTNFAYLIEGENGKHSYTFKITRQNPQNRLENLVLNENNTGGFDLFIAKYNITELEYNQLQNGGNPNLVNKLDIVPVANNIIDINYQMRGVGVDGMCLTATIIPGNICPEKIHTFENAKSCKYFDQGTFVPYKEQIVYTMEPCADGSSGSSGGDPIDYGNYNGPDNDLPSGEGLILPPDGTPGSGSPNIPPDNTDPEQGDTIEDTQNPVNTTPVVEPIETPCDKIKKGTTSNDYKIKFKSLTNNYNLSHETGFAETELNGQKEYVDCLPIGTNVVRPPSGSKNLTHVHQNVPLVSPNGIAYDGRVKIFSVADLQNLITLLQLNNTDPKDAFATMISNEAIYSITILEPIALDTLFRQKFRKFTEDYKIEAKNIIEGFHSKEVRNDLLKIMFLKGVKKMGLENKIGLFEGTIENETATNISDYKINWERKKIKKTLLGVVVESIPCDN